MLKFNIKNVKYALPDETGDYTGAVIKSLGEANNLSLEPQVSEQEIYADGQVAYVLMSDQGLNGTLGLVTQNEQYEIDMGHKMKLDDDTVIDIQQTDAKEHAIYYEVDIKATKYGPQQTLKTWLFGVTTTKPTESYEQTTDSVNNQNLEATINILGTRLQGPDGDYVDENGNTRKVWRQVSKPGDSGYAAFGNSVPVPTKTA